MRHIKERSMTLIDNFNGDISTLKILSSSKLKNLISNLIADTKYGFDGINIEL